jgi:Tfp pilus assembly major pilin PilA
MQRLILVPIRINLYYLEKTSVTEDISLASELKTGAESREIDLKNKDKEIKNVTFVYRTVTGSGTKKSEVELWGLK